MALKASGTRAAFDLPAAMMNVDDPETNAP